MARFRGWSVPLSMALSTLSPRFSDQKVSDRQRHIFRSLCRHSCFAFTLAENLWSNTSKPQKLPPVIPAGWRAVS